MPLFQPPPYTRYDLNFTFFGIPVRVHPLFWLMTLLLGASSGNAIRVLTWVITVFVSILIHELGHSFMMRAYGQNSYIVLYIGGGLTVPTSSRRNRRGDVLSGSTQQILISLAGPFAGFLLAGLLLAMVAGMRGFITIDWFLGIIPLPHILLLNGGWVANSVLNTMLWVNVFWGLINLMPIYPLDGGNVARELLVKADPRDGVRKSLWLSVVSGAVVAAIGLAFLSSMYMALFFGFLALQSYQTIRGGYGQRL